MRRPVLFVCLLALFPARFRHEFGDEVMDYVSSRYRECGRNRIWPFIQITVSMSVDLLIGAITARVAGAARSALVARLAAGVSGMAGGAVVMGSAFGALEYFVRRPIADAAKHGNSGFQGLFTLIAVVVLPLLLIYLSILQRPSQRREAAD